MAIIRHSLSNVLRFNKSIQDKRRTTMKNILLIGDSIRFGATPKPHLVSYGKVCNGSSPGYGVYVKEKLDGIANVYAPDENCRFAQYTLRYLHNWAVNLDLPCEEIDVVHWNNGLWDALRLFGDEPMTPIEVYGYMLERVYKRIRLLFPNAKVIFATSTAVVEDWANPDFCRYNHEIEQYNQKAVEVMEKLGVQVNDLYAITSKFDDSLHSDWVHFGEKGSEILADAVIKACLG